MNLQGVVECVNKLNELLTDETWGSFSLNYNTVSTSISYKDTILWCDDWDNIGYDDELDQYKHLLDYIKKEFNKKVLELTVVNLLINKK